jgi:hypothetical protein
MISRDELQDPEDLNTRSIPDLNLSFSPQYLPSNETLRSCGSMVLIIALLLNALIRWEV